MWHGQRPVSADDRTWQDSPLGRCLLVSALAHGLAFAAWLAKPSTKPMPPAVLQVALLPAQMSLTAAKQTDLPALSKAEPSHKVNQPAKSVPPAIHEALQAVPQKSAQAVLATAAPSISSQPVVPANATPTRQDSSVASVATAPAPSSSSSASPAEGRRHDAASMASLDAYAQTLSALLARQRSYPTAAAMRGWEGEVRLTLRIARRGALLEVQIQHSSGYEVLDRNAVQLVQQAAPLPQPPEGLEANEFQVSVPIHYRLKKSS